LKWLHGDEKTAVQAARHYRRLPDKKMTESNVEEGGGEGHIVGFEPVGLK